MRPKKIKTVPSIVTTVIFSATLGACGGGGSSSTATSSNPGSGSAVPPAAPTSYTIGGTAIGLNGGVLKLQNNGTDTQTLTSEGGFQFSSITSGSPYSVAVSQHPAARQCNVANGSGNATANVNNVSVSCSPGQVSTLYSFTGANGDGQYPEAGLAQDSAGNLFGTTYGGGSAGPGTVFQLKRNADGTYASPVTLYAFTGAGAGGTTLNAGLIVDRAGNLIGTTNTGGSSNAGTIFELTRNADGSYSPAVTLHSFTGVGTDGAYPDASLVQDGAGNLFGTTIQGGSANAGTVFELARKSDGTYATPTTLYSFTGTASDGKAPEAGLVLDSAGNLFGTTSAGGAANSGTVFELVRGSNGTFGPAVVLHSFSGTGSDGAIPNSPLVADAAGNLFGTSSAGGAASLGTVFMLRRSGDGTYTPATTLHSFAGGSADGAYPDAGLVLDGAGNIFGTTNAGGSANSGTVFEIRRNSDGTYASAISLLHVFTGVGSDGNAPSAGLILDSTGNLLGTTNMGGTAGLGTVFVLN
ncbi:choice-of-anchor tandem repeat GloVer-containing protein [Caballeronia sp. GAWG1-5s-s]|uniref:choice-of-anchor tandem repeat GloVer-containing protein n=1 Tax=Caballeronia sp. GAWG1-5s-s TaxID=2921743 RepID=UPI002028A2F1|nr:choice-of-anchor tandem repeat GloVer-containing protein [Caballeronia sp. GAWG1-5s-s]